jgi:hypothetical protein
MMVGRPHPTARAELAIGVAVFLIGAAIGVLVEAAELIARARRDEREQLRGAGRLLDELEDERDELRRQLDAAAAADTRRQRDAEIAGHPHGSLTPCVAPCAGYGVAVDGADCAPSVCDGMGHGCPHVEPDAGYEADVEHGHGAEGRAIE